MEEQHGKILKLASKRTAFKVQGGAKAIKIQVLLLVVPQIGLEIYFFGFWDDVGSNMGPTVNLKLEKKLSDRGLEKFF